MKDEAPHHRAGAAHSMAAGGRSLPYGGTDATVTPRGQEDRRVLAKGWVALIAVIIGPLGTHTHLCI